MTNLFEEGRAAEFARRINSLKPDSQRQWGKMGVAQMLAHCSTAMQMAMGEMKPPRILFGRIIGGIIKPMVLKQGAPMKRNSPTAKELIISDSRDFLVERDRLCGLVDRFAKGGPTVCTEHPHAFFGRLTPEEWSALMDKHLDHHLRQFGV